MKLLATAFTLATICLASAHAGSFTVSADRSALEAAFTGPYTVEDFGDSARFPISTGILNSATHLPAIGIVPGLIQPGVSYSTLVGTGNFFNIDSGGGFAGGFLDTVTGDRLLTVRFDSPVLAFGFDTNSLSPSLQVVVSFTDATTQTYSASINSATFVGFTSTGAGIASAVIGDLNNPTFSFAIDNMTFANTAPVPEPAAIALMLAGLGVVGVAARRRKRQG